MSNTYEIYVISNSDLFREGLNAIAAFCQSTSFKSATYMGSAIGVVMTAIAFLKQHDPLVYLKWLVMYFFVFQILLGVPQTIEVINVSDSSVPAYKIDGIPFGIALPAHLITAIGQGFSSDLELVFHMPNSFQYNQTGMLFGSNLFRLSLKTQLDDPEVMDEMNAYVRSCVIGDILINHKYSLDDLLHSNDLWALMSSKPSPVRGIFINDQFNTCIQAAQDLNIKINNYSQNVAPRILARLIPSHRAYAYTTVNALLESSYQQLCGLAGAANNILKQNIVINAFRSGIRNYASETGSVESMENFSNSMAMLNTRMAWATSSHMGIQTLPLMQVVLLLLMLCLFPLIIILTLIPGFGADVFKNYIYTLIWLESWPIMFTILNLAMTFYLSHGHGEIQHVTLSNINQLAQEQSDIAGIAGYMILAIPFLSIGIVKGMAATFNQASQYLGGMMHNIGQGASSSVAMGNYSLGNVSTANATANSVNANKHDTNFSNMQGMSTEQLANASTVTMTPAGSVVSNVGGALSHLATAVNAGMGISSSLSKSAEYYKSEAESQRQSSEHSLSSAASNALAYDTSTSHSSSLSDSTTIGVSAQVDHAITNMKSLAHEKAVREGITVSDAFRKLTQASINQSIGIDSKKTLAGTIVAGTTGANVKASVDGVQQATSSTEHSYQHGMSSDLAQREASEFRKSMSVVENYSKSYARSDNLSQSAALASKIGADFRDAQSAMQSRSIDLSKGDRLSQAASYASSHSESIQSNFIQAWVDHVRQVDPVHANQLINNTSSASIAIQRQNSIENFMHQYARNYEKSVMSGSSDLTPDQHFAQAASHLQASTNAINQQFQAQSQSVNAKAKGVVGAFDQAKSTNISNSVNQEQEQIRDSVHGAEKMMNAAVENFTSTAEQAIEAGKKPAQSGLFMHAIFQAGK